MRPGCASAGRRRSRKPTAISGACPSLDTLLQDVRYAARGLRRDAGFALIALATLALGIGATTTIFSLVRGVLLDPLPYPDAGRLVRVYESNPQFPAFPVGPYGLLAYRHENRTLAGFAGYVREDLQLAIDSRPERLRGLQVSSNYFEVLGVRPAIGRPFTWAEEREHADVAILSDAVWRRAVPGRPRRGRPRRAAERRDCSRSSASCPQGSSTSAARYRSTAQGETVDVWWPLPLEKREQAKGVALHQRGRAPEAWCHGADRRGPISPRCRRASGAATTAGGTSAPCRCSTTSSAARATRSRLLLLGVGVVMLIACANVSSLMLARATARRRERAVRFALGASRWRLVRQSIAESLVLALPGAVGGALLAAAGVGLLTAVLPQDFPRLHNVRVDIVVLAFSAAARRRGRRGVRAAARLAPGHRRRASDAARCGRAHGGEPPNGAAAERAGGRRRSRWPRRCSSARACSRAASCACSRRLQASTAAASSRP